MLECDDLDDLQFQCCTKNIIFVKLSLNNGHIQYQIIDFQLKIPLGLVISTRYDCDSIHIACYIK